MSASVRHWTETSAETIWRGKYTNCDKGYFVDLPPGVVAHAVCSPSPNHGFLVSTSAPGTTDRVTSKHPSFIGVFDEYNSMKLGSARAYLDWELKNIPNPDLIDVQQIVFRELPAVEAEYRATVNGQQQQNRVLIVFREKDDLVYEIVLCTQARDYIRDVGLYEKIKAGFQVFPIPGGECLNP